MTRGPGRGKRERGPEEARSWLRENQGAFAAWPKIEALSDQFGFHVTGKVDSLEGRVGPGWGALIFLFILCGFLGALIGGSIFEDRPEINGGVIGWWVGSVGVFILGGVWLLNVRKAAIDIVITPQKIGVGKRFGYEWIERGFGASFEVVRPHSKTYQQKDKGRKIGDKEREVFQVSEEVILVSGANRVVVAEIFDNKQQTESLHMTLFLLNQAV